ncbi:MAG: ABC transporter substrate-binding protein [Desulfobacteraceae bacterium]|jgi:phospholipid transport system substrate-binding protein
MMPKGLLQIIAVFFLIFTLTIPARANGPMERIKETTDKIIDILSDPDLKGPDKAEEKRRRLRQVVDERFDWEEFARRAMGKHWRKRTDEEKREFIPLFGKLVERTYMDKVEDYSGERVVYVSERTKAKYGLVKAKVVTNDRREIDVDYRLKNKRSDWYVYDVVVVGVSLVKSYRVQFNEIIMQSSYEELLKRLKNKLAAEE